MKLKKSLLAIFATGFVAGTAHAEVEVLNNDKARVEVYGILDAAVGHVQHSLSVDPQFIGSVNPVNAVKTTVPSSATGVFNGAMQDSRLGFKGNADIGDGMKGFFTLEEGFNLPTANVNNAAAALASNAVTATTASANSSLNGQLFNRQAFVGLSHDKWGSLAVGRNYAPMYPMCKVYDPVVSDLFSPLGFSGTYGGGGGISEDTRVDGSLKYTNKIGAYNFGTLYKFGGAANSGSAKSGFTIDGGYDEGNFGIQAAYEEFRDAAKGASSKLTPNAVDVTVYDTKAFMIAAKYKINDAATAKIGYETYTLSAPSGATPLPTNYYGQFIGTASNFSSAPQATHVVWVGGDYNFTEKLNLAAGYYNIAPQQSADAKQLSGNQRYLATVLDYRVTKSFDTYAGFTYSTYTGDQYPSTTYYRSNEVTAVGARFKF